MSEATAKFFAAMRELATDDRCEGFMSHFVLGARAAGLLETQHKPDAFGRNVVVHVLTEEGRRALAEAGKSQK